ncbi:MAG: hypothetical protein V7K61_29350 [Nostoc sp.]
MWSLSGVVPLAYGTLRERGSKLRAASRREVQRAVEKRGLKTLLQTFNYLRRPT